MKRRTSCELPYASGNLWNMLARLTRKGRKAASPKAQEGLKLCETVRQFILLPSPMAEARVIAKLLTEEDLLGVFVEKRQAVPIQRFQRFADWSAQAART